MDPQAFFALSNVVIVAGKGGVGKTTVTAALGLAAARAGVDTLLVELEGKRGLASVFESAELTYEERNVLSRDAGDPADLRVRTIEADDALLDYMKDHGLKGFAKTLNRMAVLDTLATSTPGLKDLIVLGKIKQLEREQSADLILVDAPASGHAVSFLRSAAGLQATVDTGPIKTQANEVVRMLTDPERCQVILVAIPEETPVNELIDTAYQLEDEVGINLSTLVLNSIYDEFDHLDETLGSRQVRDPQLRAELERAGDFWRLRSDQQREQMRRLTEELPLEQLHMDRIFTSQLSRADLEVLADQLTSEIDALEFLQ